MLLSLSFIEINRVMLRRNDDKRDDSMPVVDDNIVKCK